MKKKGNLLMFLSQSFKFHVKCLCQKMLFNKK